jgi:hypothetical protein
MIFQLPYPSVQSIANSPRPFDELRSEHILVSHDTFGTRV